MAGKNPCTHRAYALKREGQETRWLEIGVATMHLDSKAIDVYIDRLPVGGFNGFFKLTPNETPPGDPPAPQSAAHDNQQS